MKLINFISKACFSLKDSDVSALIVTAMMVRWIWGLPRAEKSRTVSKTGSASVCRHKRDGE